SDHRPLSTLVRQGPFPIAFVPVDGHPIHRAPAIPLPTTKIPLAGTIGYDIPMNGTIGRAGVCRDRPDARRCRTAIRWLGHAIRWSAFPTEPIRIGVRRAPTYTDRSRWVVTLRSSS